MASDTYFSLLPDYAVAGDQSVKNLIVGTATAGTGYLELRAPTGTYGPMSTTPIRRKDVELFAKLVAEYIVNLAGQRGFSIGDVTG